MLWMELRTRKTYEIDLIKPEVEERSPSITF